MAALHSGIHLKLKSPQIPWERKLRLARFAWMSSQCLLPNKEQALLDWCIHALTGWHNKKLDFSPDVLKGLWGFLENALHSQKLRILLSQGKIFTFRFNMAQMLLDQLQECANAQSPLGAPTLLSVLKGFFSSPVLSALFTSKYELIVNLLSKFCLLACQEIQISLLAESQSAQITGTSPPDPPQTNDVYAKRKKRHNLFEVLLNVLSCYLSVQREQANPNRVFTVVTNQLIQPLVLLRYLLTSQEFASSTIRVELNQQWQKDIRMKIESVLQLALFPPEHLISYKVELLPAKEDSGSAGTKRLLKPVGALLGKLSDPGNCKQSLHYSVKSDALALLYKFFVASYGKERENTEEEQRMLCFYFLVRLVPALGLHPDGCSPTGAKARPGFTSCFSAFPSTPENWHLALSAMEALLSQALSADIYNVAADRIRHKEVQLNFYRSLAQILLKETKPRIPSWYRCLKVLLNLNHLILEPDLEQLLSCAWVDAEDMEPQAQEAKQLMVCSLLQIYTKLRQLPHLFSSLFSVICQPARADLRPPLLSEAITTSLRTCFLDTPPSQILQICSSVLKSINTCLLPDLGKDGEADEMEVDGAHENDAKEDASLKLASLTHLLHVIVMNLKVLDNTSPLPLVRQCQGLMEEMQQTIKQLLETLPTEKPDASPPKRKKRKCLNPKAKENVLEVNGKTLWVHKTCEAALLLRYTWVEVDTLFHIYCCNYSSVDSFLSARGEEDNVSFSSSLLIHTENLISGAFFTGDLHPSFLSPTSRLLLKHLTLQQMKKILLASPSSNESGAVPPLNKAARFILAGLEFEEEPDGEQGWDGQLASVKASHYHVAHWYLIASNLSLILPHLSGEEVSRIGNVLVCSLQDKQIENLKSLPPSWLSFSFVSLQLLASPAFPEMSSLFSATVRSLMEKFVRVLQTGRRTKDAPKFLTFYQKERGNQSSEGQLVSPPVKKEAIAEDILASSKVDAHILLTDAQTEKLLRLIQIVNDLNQDGINSEDLSSLFLLLFYSLTSTSRQPDQTSADSRESGVDALFLTKLLMLLDHLLKAKTFHGVLKLIHGGALLQTMVSHLLNSPRVRITGCTDWLKTAQSFIQSLVDLIITRNNSVRLNLNQFATYLSSEEIAGPTMSAHTLLACRTAFCQALISNLGKSKPLDRTLIQILAKTTESLGGDAESIVKPQTETGIQLGSVLGKAFIVEVFTVVLRSEAAALSLEDSYKTNLTRRALYQDFCQLIFREIHSSPQSMDFLVSSLSFLSVFYTTRENRSQEDEGNALEELFAEILKNVQRLLAAPWMSSTDVAQLEPAVQELLQHLVEKSSPTQFDLLLTMIRESLDICKLRAGNHREVLSAVIFSKLLARCPLPETCARALWLFVPHILSAMVVLVRSSSQGLFLTLDFTVPTVTSMTSLLRQGEGLIPNPHNVILILEALHWLQLKHLSPPVYHTVFLAVHEALFSIIQCHPQVILKAAPSFLNIFYRLVESIMQEGRQRGDSDSGSDSDEYLWCSRLVERMYTHIAATSEGFTALSAFIVAQYVTELQKVTLRPDVKSHLTEGIYCILDLCKEQDLKFLKTSLNAGVREVFNELYSSYTHYHKTQRQGEDKYTV